MGVCISAEPKNATKGEQQASRQLEEDLRTTHADDNAIHKLLLLGAGESGKSTLFKQMIQIYGKGFNEKDRKSYVPIIYRNVVACIEELVKRSEELPKLNERFSECKITSQAALDSMKFITETRYEDGTLTPEMLRHVIQLWADPAIQKTFEQRSLFQLNDSAKYFFDRLEDITTVDYMPTDQDILHARVRTTGIIENDFIIDNNKFKMVDVGGQRNERKKWIHCFDNVTAVLFVADMAAYDRKLYEDEKVNRIEETLNLFENICNSKWFRTISIILFLNKVDIFKEKIVRSPLKVGFPEYTGENTFEVASAYMEQEFLKRNHYKKPIYCHMTCATDTRNVSVVFNGVKDIVVRGALESSGLI